MSPIKMNELLEKIRKIEALIQGAKTEGEKDAAILAKNRVHKKVKEKEKQRKPLSEYTLYTPDSWHKKLLLAICRKHNVRPYRYYRQKYTTVMVKVDEDFLNDVIWVEYLEYSKHLEVLVEDITNNLIAKIHGFQEEEVIEKKQLGR